MGDIIQYWVTNLKTLNKGYIGMFTSQSYSNIFIIYSHLEHKISFCLYVPYYRDAFDPIGQSDASLFAQLESVHVVIQGATRWPINMQISSLVFAGQSSCLKQRLIVNLATAFSGFMEHFHYGYIRDYIIV